MPEKITRLDDFRPQCTCPPTPAVTWDPTTGLHSRFIGGSSGYRNRHAVDYMARARAMRKAIPVGGWSHG